MVRQAKRARVAASTLAVAAIGMSGASAALTTSVTPVSTYGSLQFNAIPITYPSDNPMFTTGATINGVATTFPGYNAIFRSGDVNNNYVFGQMIDKFGNNIMAINDTSIWQTKSCTAGTSGTYTCAPGYAANTFYQSGQTNAVAPISTVFNTCTGGRLDGCANATKSSIPEISNDPDYTSLMVVGGNLFSITQFEAPIPSAMYLTQLVQDPTTGVLSAKAGSMVPVNWAAYGGIMNTCAGSTTPWNSHLASEETTIADGRDWAANMFGTVTTAQGFRAYSNLNSFVPPMRYFNIYPNAMTAANTVANLNPYMYGYLAEVKVQGPQQYTAAKHFWMGRASWEMAYVMPDQKTLYGGVDVGNGAFYKMVATTAGDLSGGSLYCAVMASAGQAASFGVTWKLMSTTTNAAMLTLLNTTLTGSATSAGVPGVAPTQVTFDDIFNTALPTNATTGACPVGFNSVNIGYTYTVNSVTYYNECLQLNPANPNAATLAAATETGRYAGYVGCTTEFNKWEGLTFSRRRNQVYAALSYWSSSNAMNPTLSTAGVPLPADIGGSQDISIPWNANYACGCVFYMNTDANYNINSFAPLVCGIAQSADANGNTCSPLSVSSPDNVAMIEDFDTLMIGEDTSTRRTDLIWQYTFPNPPGQFTPDGGVLTPIFSTMYGAETTSPFWYNLGNGQAYISAVIQHPYGESDNSWAFVGNNPTTTTPRSWVGFIGPINVNTSAAPRAAVGAAIAAVAAAVFAVLL